jgi:ABC-type multidrug transport system fused ATPase/permease subunit
LVIKSLQISDCPKLKCLPMCIQNLTDMKDLKIFGCRDLKKRSEREIGEDWQKISHIQDIQIFSFLINLKRRILYICRFVFISITRNTINFIVLDIFYLQTITTWDIKLVNVLFLLFHLIQVLLSMQFIVYLNLSMQPSLYPSPWITTSKKEYK